MYKHNKADHTMYHYLLDSRTYAEVTRKSITRRRLIRRNKPVMFAGHMRMGRYTYIRKAAVRHWVSFVLLGGFA